MQNTFAFPVAHTAREAIVPVCERLAQAGVKVRTFGVVRLFPHYARRWGLSPTLAAWIIRHAARYDIVHIHGTWGLVQVIALLTAKHVHRPTVVTPHESLTSYDVGHTRPVAKRHLKRLYLGHVSLFVLSSRLEAEDTLPDTHSARGVVIHHPVPEIEARADAIDPRDARPLVVGFLGRLNAKKNLPLLVRALARASPDARLRVAGDGPPELKAAVMKVVAEVGLDDRVEWLGFVPRTSRNDYFDSIDLLAMPSRYECFGMAAAEAIARGVPVIVSSTTGIADVVHRHRCGLVGDPTVEGIAEKLSTLDDDRQLVVDLGHRGPTAALAELSMTTYGFRMKAEYEAIMAG